MPRRPHPRRRRALLRAAGLGVAVAIPVAVLAYLVRAESDLVVEADQHVIRAATGWTRGHPGARDALLAWQEIFNVRWVALAGLAASAAFGWRHHGLRTRALWAAGTVAGVWALQLGVKALVQRARPVVDDALAHAPGSSFPSGHATQITATCVTLTLLAWPTLGRTARVVVPVLGVLLVVVTGADRILLGVHFPSDVAAGVLLGGGAAVASYVGYRGWHDDDPGTRPPALPSERTRETP